MGTTDATGTTDTTHTTRGSGTAAIVLTKDELLPYVTHAPTRHWLTGPGLPGESGGLLTFAALRADGPRRVGDSTGEPDRLAQNLRDQLVMGGLTALEGQETESVLLDGATGEISTTYFLHDRPDLMDRSPLAPSLRTLVGFATAADELAGLRGQFAAYAGRFGPQAVAEASRHLLSIFEAGTPDAALAPLWRMTALIRPLARIAAPGSGLALDLPPRLLDEEFGAGAIVRFEDIDFPATLTHEPTRRFLRHMGLPEDGFWFTLDTEVPLPTLTEYYALEREGVLTEAQLPSQADRLIRLGYLLEDTSMVVDGSTGRILSWSEPDLTLRPLNTDISTLAFTLWLIHREKSLDADHDLTDAHGQLAATMSRTLSTVDPLVRDPTPSTPADDGRRYWPGVFEAEAGGGLYP